MFGPGNLITEEATCETCYAKFQRWRYDEHENCVTCRQMKALERIADVLEHYVGML